MQDLFNSIATGVAVVLSFASLLISIYIFFKSRILSMQPILVFTKHPTEDKRLVYNVGYGPALDILLAKRAQHSNEWTEPERIPPLGTNTYIECYTGYELRCDYCDADGREYKSTCMHYKTTVTKRKSSLPDWPEEEIRKSRAVPCSF